MAVDAAAAQESEGVEEQGDPFRPPFLTLPKVGDSAQSGTDPDIVQESPVAVLEMPLPVHNFEGISNVDSLLPSDANGDIGYDPDTGTKYYMQWVNVSLAVWDVTNPNDVVLEWGPVDGNVLFDGFGGVCEATNHGDPIVLFDHLENRWVAGQFALPNFPNGPFYQCMAVSQTADPSGSWHRYEFAWPVNKMNDYPKLAVWEDAYYVTANQFHASSLTWGGAGVGAFEKAAMVDGEPAEFVFFDLFAANAGYGGILPADLDGEPPPSGTPGYFAEWDDSSWLDDPADTVRIWEFHVDWTNSANSTFGVGGEPNDMVTTADVDPDMCSYARVCIPQPGGTAVDAISDRLMHRLVYRSRGGGTLLSNHTVDVSGSDHAGIHWFEVRDEGGGWEMYQEGVYAPDSDHRWMGSLAMDRQGNIALGYSVSSNSTFPSIRYAGRLAADPLNQLGQGEAELITGSGYQQHSSGRWGDYSMMSVDPVDGCTFWYTQQYYATISSASWQTRIGSFQFPSCGSDSAGTLAGTVTDGVEPLVDVRVSASRTITEHYVTTTGSGGVYSMMVPAGTYAVTASKYGYQSSSVSGVDVVSSTTTVQDFALTPLRFYEVQGTVSDASTGWPLYAAIEIDGYPGDPVWTDPETGAYRIMLAEGMTYTLHASAWADGYLPGSHVVPDLAADGVVDFALDVDAGVCAAPGYVLDYEYLEDFEGGDGNYVASGEVTSWEYGTPSSGPGGAHSGDFLWATDLVGDYGNSEDGYITSPAIDLSALAGNDLVFTWWQYYDGEECCDEISVEVSNDGGASWGVIYGPFDGSDVEEQVWEQQSVILDSTYAVGDFQLRFHFVADTSVTYPGWYVDDVGVGAVAAEGALACVPQPGGLVVGNVFDGNTGDGIDDVVVDNEAGYTTMSRGTAADEAVSEGFYTLFSPSGSQTFTATLPDSGYGADVDSVTVVQSDTVRWDFDLPAGRLTIGPESFSTVLEMGDSTSLDVTLDNDGDLDVAWRAIELDGGRTVLGPFEQPDVVVKPFRQAFSTTEGLDLPSPPPADPFAAGDVLRAWAPAGNGDPWGIAFDGDAGAVWVSEGWGDDHVDEYTVAGSPTGISWPFTWSPIFGPADATFNWNTGMLWIMNVETGVSNCIYEIDPAAGFTGNNICPGDEVGFSTSQRGLAYDPSNDTYMAGGWNDMMVYRFAPDGTILESVYTGLAISGLAYNPDTEHLFAMVNDDPNLVYVLDAADGYNVVGQFAVGQGFGPYAGSGLEIDCDGNLWAVDQETGTVYQFESGELATVCAREVAWLSAEPVTGTVAVGSQGIVDVNLDAGVPEVNQPGDYYGQLQIHNDTPYGDFYVPVTMTVNAPASWGELSGVVTGLEQCDVAGNPLEGATVFIEASNGMTATVETGAAGDYKWWLDAVPSSPVTVTASMHGYAERIVGGLIVEPGETTTQDVYLRPELPCASHAPASLSATVVAGAAQTRTLSINNSGAAELTYRLLEVPGGLSYGPESLPARTFTGPAATGPGSVLSLAGRSDLVPPPPAAPDSGWYEGLSLPNGVVRYGHAQCYENPGSFYVISGVDATLSLTDEVWSYDALSNSWTELAPLPDAVEAPAAVCYRGRLYVMGGSGRNSFYIYDIGDDAWMTGARLLAGVSGAAAGAWDGVIYLAGGDDDFTPGTGVSDQIWTYDIERDTWRTMPEELVAGTSFPGFVQAGRYLYIVGGWDAIAPSANVLATQRLDMERGVVEVGPLFASGRADFALAATADALYAVGGDPPGGTLLQDPTDLVERYALAEWPGGSWSDTGDPLPVARVANSAGYCTGSLFPAEVRSVGGFDGSVIQDDNRFLGLPESCFTVYEDVPWLYESPAEGSVAADSAVTAVVTFDATGMAPGTYRAALQAETSDPQASSFRIPVTLTVETPVQGVALAADAVDKSVYAGSLLTYTLSLTNTGNTAGVFDVEVEDDAWYVDWEGPNQEIAPGETVMFELLVHIPIDARPGDWDRFTVTALLQQDPAVAASVTLHARVVVADRKYLPAMIRP